MLALKAARENYLRKTAVQSTKLLNVCSLDPPDTIIIRKELRRLRKRLKALEDADLSYVSNVEDDEIKQILSDEYIDAVFETDLAVETAEEILDIPIVRDKVILPGEEEHYSDESEAEDAEDLDNNFGVVEIKEKEENVGKCHGTGIQHEGLVVSLTTRYF